MSEIQQELNTVKIITWNVNGIRSLYKDAVAMKQGLDLLDGDIICLQETRITRSSLDEGTAIVDGYNSYYGFPRSRSGYSGVATYCKDAFTPFRAEEGLSGLFASSDAVDSVGCYGSIRAEFSKMELKELDFEGRAVITQHKIKISDSEDKALTIINVYCPRADLDNAERLQVKLRFYHLLEIRTRALLDSGSFVIIVGDINTCHKPIDHCDPSDMEEFIKNPCRKWLNHIIYEPNAEENTNNVNVSSFHLIDAFRFVNPVEENAFTCWSTQLNARSTNYGTRIDYILIDLRLGGEMDDCVILKDVLGSDHCPVKAIIDLKFVRAPKCPSFCTKYYPEFSGTQKKLSEFFSNKSSNQELCMGTTFNCKYDTSVASGKRKMLDTKVKSKRSKSDTRKQKGISNFFQLLPSGTQTTESCGSADLDDQDSGNRSSLESLSSLSSLSEVSSDNIEPTSFEPLAVIDAQSSVDMAEGNFPAAMFSKSVGQQSFCTAPGREKKAASDIWRSMLTGPKPPPKCKGHREPCIQRCVKKKGPNFSRKFWVCARGEGRCNDPSARCDYFLWDSNR